MGSVTSPDCVDDVPIAPPVVPEDAGVAVADPDPPARGDLHVIDAVTDRHPIDDLAITADHQRVPLGTVRGQHALGAHDQHTAVAGRGQERVGQLELRDPREHRRPVTMTMRGDDHRCGSSRSGAGPLVPSPAGDDREDLEIGLRAPQRDQLTCGSHGHRQERSARGRRGEGVDLLQCDDRLRDELRPLLDLARGLLRAVDHLDAVAAVSSAVPPGRILHGAILPCTEAVTARPNERRGVRSRPYRSAGGTCTGCSRSSAISRRRVGQRRRSITFRAVSAKEMLQTSSQPTTSIGAWWVAICRTKYSVQMTPSTIVGICRSSSSSRRSKSRSTAIRRGSASGRVPVRHTRRVRRARR